MHFPIKRYIAINAILSCVGILLGYVESLLIPDLFLPGMKLGISNIVILYAVINMRKRDAFCIGLIKSLVNGLAFSGLMSCFYSVCGVFLSVLIMIMLKKFYPLFFSCTGISVAGSAFFNIGQVLAAVLILRTIAPIYYLGYYLLLSVLTGIVTGIVTEIIIKKGVVKIN